MEDIFSEALEKAHTRKGILGSISESKQDFLEKGKRAQVGEIREWRGQKFQKQPNGGWIPVKSEKKSEKKEEKSEEKKDTHGVEKKVLDFLAVSSNKYNDISKVSIYKTPKGNWALQYDGKDVSVVGGNTLPEADLKAAGLLEEEEEEETKKEEIEMPSEKDFFRATGLRYNHPVEDYQVSLAILNEVPDDHKMWTGKTAGEMKELLTKQITKLGGSTDVGTMKDWFIDE